MQKLYLKGSFQARNHEFEEFYVEIGKTDAASVYKLLRAELSHVLQIRRNVGPIALQQDGVNLSGSDTVDVYKPVKVVLPDCTVTTITFRLDSASGALELTREPESEIFNGAEPETVTATVYKLLTNFFFNHTIMKDIGLDRVSLEDVVRVLPKLKLYSFKLDHGEQEESFPTCKTRPDHAVLQKLKDFEGPVPLPEEDPLAGHTASCLVFFCPYDSWTLLEARIVHELTHGLRYLLSVLQRRRCTRTLVKELPDKCKDKYMMVSRVGFDSGFYAEHEVLGGITVLLLGRMKGIDSNVVETLSTPFECTVTKMEILEGDWMLMTFRDKGTEVQVYFDGCDITQGRGKK
eukprot:EG_transcript_13835